MAKAIISNRIYIDCPPEGYDDIKKALTYKIEQKGAGKGGKHTSIEIIRTYKMLPKNILSIPQGRSDLIPAGYEIVDKRVFNEMPFPEPLLELRPEQQIVYDEVNDTCFINALVGWGKTCTALYLARKLGQKTLIVTHNTMLRDQWVSEIQKLYGMEAGVIGSGYFDIDHAIVVGNVQTVTKNVLALSKEFGTVILDEAHHCPATTFGAIIDSLYARYRIALSGTMTRKDGKHVLFRDYFGSEVHKPPQSHTLNPSVRILKPGIRLTDGEIWVKKINNLLYDPDYQDYIATVAATQIRMGYSVLIVASRVEFLQRVKELIGDDCVLVTGETSFEGRVKASEQIESEEKSCIAGSRQIFSEGISINRLDCVILPEPIAQEANLEQIVGRIMRKHPSKKSPVVLDVHFSDPASRKQNNLRLGMYMNKGWEVSAV